MRYFKGKQFKKNFMFSVISFFAFKDMIHTFFIYRNRVSLLFLYNHILFIRLFYFQKEN